MGSKHRAKKINLSKRWQEISRKQLSISQKTEPMFLSSSQSLRKKNPEPILPSGGRKSCKQISISQQKPKPIFPSSGGKASKQPRNDNGRLSWVGALVLYRRTGLILPAQVKPPLRTHSARTNRASTPMPTSCYTCLIFLMLNARLYHWHCRMTELTIKSSLHFRESVSNQGMTMHD